MVSFPTDNLLNISDDLVFFKIPAMFDNDVEVEVVEGERFGIGLDAFRDSFSLSR